MSMQVGWEKAYSTACSVLGNSMVQQQLLGERLAEVEAERDALSVQVEPVESATEPSEVGEDPGRDAV